MRKKVTTLKMLSSDIWPVKKNTSETSLKGNLERTSFLLSMFYLDQSIMGIEPKVGEIRYEK
jgi:hypothetical protein